MNIHPTSIIGSSYGKENSNRFSAVNPATGEKLHPEFYVATPEDLNKAAELAASAFESYSKVSARDRAALLKKIADGLDHAVDSIVEITGRETALPETRLRGETARTSGQLRLFVSLIEEGSWVDARIDHGDPDRAPIPKPDVRCKLHPLGPVAVFGASNFPLAFSVAGGDTASALAAGCPVIVKAHSSHPHTSALVGKIIKDAVSACGLHEGVFSMLLGSGRTLGQQLVSHPVIKAVGFTGSRSAGETLMKLASQRPSPIPVYAEMSSINPVVVLPSGLLDPTTLANGYFSSLTLGVGQFCTNPGLLLLIDSNNGEMFKQELKERVEAGVPATLLSSGIAHSFQCSNDNIAQQDGVKVLAKSTTRANLNQARVVVYETSAAEFLANECLSSEMFGPAGLLINCPHVKSAEEIIKSLEGQLTISIFGSEREMANCAHLLKLAVTKAGRLVCNQFPTGVEVCSAMVHGGPFPATSDGRSTSVGTGAILRFTRLVAYQNWPNDLLPPELEESNPLGIHRLVDGK